MKKIFLFSFIVFSLFSFKAFASVSFNPDGPQQISTPIEIICGSGNTFYAFNNGIFYGAGNCNTGTSFDNAGNYTILECLENFDCGDNLLQARLSDGYVSENTYRLNLPDEQLAGGFFYGRDPDTGKSKANELVAMVGNASGKTMETMGGVVGMTGGIIFAFGFILYIRSLINEANIEKKNKERGL